MLIKRLVIRSQNVFENKLMQNLFHFIGDPFNLRWSSFLENSDRFIKKMTVKGDT